MTRVFVLGSVLLPQAAAELFADALATHCYDVSVVVPADTSSVERVESDYLDAITGQGKPLLVAHSNAGNYIPAITARTKIAGVLFMDAVLPPLSGGREVYERMP